MCFLEHIKPGSLDEVDLPLDGGIRRQVHSHPASSPGQAVRTGIGVDCSDKAQYASGIPGEAEFSHTKITAYLIDLLVLDMEAQFQGHTGAGCRVTTNSRLAWGGGVVYPRVNCLQPLVDPDQTHEHTGRSPERDWLSASIVTHS